jgi:hypothetical protein
MEDWPFADAPDVCSVTVRQVIQGSEPILLVVHDAENGDWQFLTGGDFHVADGMLVALSNMVRRDSSIAELADLPLGWQVWRASLAGPWQRSPCEIA